MDLKHSNPLVILWMFEEGEAISGHVGNEPMSAPCRVRYGDVESPWVTVKDWRCEPAFFAYFLCAGAPKEVPLGDKESDCHTAQGQRPRREGTIADASAKAKRTQQQTASQTKAK